MIQSKTSLYIYPIFLDGPWKGCQVELPAHYLSHGYVVREMPDIRVTDWLIGLPGEVLTPNFNDTFYYFHQIGFLRYRIIVASVKPFIDGIDGEIMSSLILSPAAKKAIT